MTGYYRTIAFKFHCFALLALTAILAVSAISLHFAGRTKDAAGVLLSDGIKGRAIASRLEFLLQQHRGLVESSPAEIDRDRLLLVKQRLSAVGSSLVDELAMSSSLRGASGGSVKLLADQLGKDMAELLAAADKVTGLAWDFVQDQAVAASQGPYSIVAQRMQQELSAWGEERSAILDQQIFLLDQSADTLISKVLACAAAGLVLCAVMVAMARRVLRRIDRIKRTMIRLARHDTDVTVPSQEDADEIGEAARAVEQFKISALRTAEQASELQRTTTQFEMALENMSQGLCLYNAANNLQVFNRRFSELYGLDYASLRPGMSFREVVELSLESGNHPGKTADEVLATRNAGRDRPESEVVLQRTKEGRTVAISQRGMDDGSWVVTYEDITGRRAAEEKVIFMARHDALTALPNRLVLDERLDQAIAEAGRGSGSAVLLLNLDHFKAVNDTLGHRVGDQLLRTVSERLMALVRETDMVARLGGDEFAVVQASVLRAEDASQLAERIVASMSAPLSIEGHQIVISVSIGIALVSQDGSDPEKLLRNADMALYRAKAEGRGTFCYFEAEMDARLQNKRQMELALRTALHDGQFELFYQPLINLERGEVSGFEALLRWNHPERGLVSPAEFIPLLEETGLIVSVGAWVQRQACLDAAAWPDGIKVAVNLSPAQFKGVDLARTVGHALRDAGLSAQRLELEITESLLLQNSEATLAALHELQKLGIKIAMDDFGTGYSSLSYLRSFPFDKVKIDQSFIRDLSTRENSIHVVRAVTGLCSGLGMSTTAEGVETRDQLSKLRAEGCTEVQGFLFSRPRPARFVPGIIESARALALECIDEAQTSTSWTQAAE